jgi:SAM-dependent methyltransferase
MSSDKIFKGHEFYDQPDIFENYTRHRYWSYNPNDTIEKPIFMDLLKGVSGEVLDLGCGYADIAETLMALGVDKYTGIDASAKMIAKGKASLSSEKIDLIVSTLEDYEYGKDRFDWMLSRLVFHYLQDPEVLFSRLRSALKDDGKFVFSVEHPVITSSMDLPRTEGLKTNWTVDQYFQEGKREQNWMGNHVEKYHRSIESWWTILKKSGFDILELREGRPRSENFKDKDEFERRSRIPMFLIFQCKKA